MSKVLFELPISEQEQKMLRTARLAGFALSLETLREIRDADDTRHRLLVKALADGNHRTARALLQTLTTSSNEG